MTHVYFLVVFRDRQTPASFRDPFFKDELNIPDGNIHLDSIAACCGCCCQQVTFQAASFPESLHLYDQLLPLTGIMVR